jgi:hypothetical protein
MKDTLHVVIFVLVVASPVLLAVVVLKILENPKAQTVLFAPVTVGASALKSIMSVIGRVLLVLLPIGIVLTLIAALVIFVKWVWYTF